MNNIIYYHYENFANPDFSLIKKFFQLKYSWFTVWCQCLLYSKATQLYTCIRTFFYLSKFLQSGSKHVSSLRLLNSGGNTAKYFILYILNILKRVLILLIYVIVIIISNYQYFLFIILACQILHAFRIYPNILPCWLFFFFFHLSLAIWGRQTVLDSRWVFLDMSPFWDCTTYKNFIKNDFINIIIWPGGMWDLPWPGMEAVHPVQGAWSLNYFPHGSVVKNPPACAGDMGTISGLGSSPGGGNGNPLHYSCLENPTDRESWRGP